MNRRSILLTVAILLAACLLPQQTSAAQLKKIRLAFSALAYANPPFWIAHDLKLFEKYGLDSEIIYVSGARPIQAMLGGSIDVSQVGGAATVAAAAATVAAPPTWETSMEPPSMAWIGRAPET